jgi:hypothetical protein
MGIGSYTVAIPDDNDKRKRARAIERAYSMRQKAAVRPVAGMRSAIEVLPLDTVLEAYAALCGGELLARECDHCGEWYATRGEGDKARRADTTKHCSLVCARRAADQAYRARNR